MTTDVPNGARVLLKVDRTAHGELDLTLVREGTQDYCSRDWLTLGALFHFAARACHEGWTREREDAAAAWPVPKRPSTCLALLDITRAHDGSLSFVMNLGDAPPTTSAGWTTLEAMLQFAALLLTGAERRTTHAQAA